MFYQLIITKDLQFMMNNPTQNFNFLEELNNLIN